MSSRRSERLAEVALWGLVLIGTLVLAHARYVGATAQVGLDFGRFYHPAAVALTHGGNPYDVPGYVYSPLVAMLVAPVTGLDLATASEVWSAAMVAAIVAAAAVTALWRVSGWRRPALVGAAELTTLHFWPTTISLWEGQVNPLVLVCLSGAVAASLHSRARLAALLLAACGALKTWPIVFGLALLVRPVNRAAVLTWLVAGLAGPGLALALGGPAWVHDMLVGPSELVEQPLVSHSIAGFTELTFDQTNLAVPLVDSRVLELGSRFALVALLVGFLVWLYRARVDRSGALVHVAAATVLLLPVSHLAYAMFVLPLVWWWARRLLVVPSTRNCAGFAVLAVWWLLVSRSWPDTNAPADLPALRYGMVFACTYLAVVASCWISAASVEPGETATSTSSAKHLQPRP